MAATSLTEEVVEEVAINLEEVAAATRRLDARGLSFFFGGVGVGLTVGFYFGYKWNKEKLRLEAFKEAEVEIDQMREFYNQKTIAAEGEAAKAAAAEIMEVQRYSEKADPRPIPAPVPVYETGAGYHKIETPTTVVQQGEGKDKFLGWSYPQELASRTPDAPYVIHQDEFKNSEHGYEQSTYTYWDGDDVLSDSDNQPLLDGKSIVGDNLKWGHGADDENVVFVRNDRLNLEIEICRDPRSWEEHVGGLDPEDALRHSSQSRPAPRKSRRTY